MGKTLLVLELYSPIVLFSDNQSASKELERLTETFKGTVVVI